MPASLAPRLTENRKRRPFVLKQPSAATNPPRNAADVSVSGDTVVMPPAEAASAHRFLASCNRALRASPPPSTGTPHLVALQLLDPSLELVPFGARWQKPRRKRNRGYVVLTQRCDAELAERLVVRLTSGLVSDAADSKVGLKRPQHLLVSTSDRNRKHERQARRAVVHERVAPPFRPEPALAGDEAAKGIPGDSPASLENLDRIGGADGIRTHDPVHAMHVLCQLSYSPRGSLHGIRRPT